MNVDILTIFKYFYNSNFILYAVSITVIAIKIGDSNCKALFVLFYCQNRLVTKSGTISKQYLNANYWTKKNIFYFNKNF